MSIKRKPDEHVDYWNTHWHKLVPKLNSVVSKAMGFEVECAWIDVGLLKSVATDAPLVSSSKWRCEPVGDHPFATALADSEHAEKMFDTPVEAAAYFIGLDLKSASETKGG